MNEFFGYVFVSSYTWKSTIYMHMHTWLQKTQSFQMHSLTRAGYPGKLVTISNTLKWMPITTLSFFTITERQAFHNRLEYASYLTGNDQMLASNMLSGRELAIATSKTPFLFQLSLSCNEKRDLLRFDELCSISKQKNVEKKLAFNHW